VTSPPCEYLEWDSTFFGIRIGRVIGDIADTERMRAIEAWAASQEVDCLYYLADVRSDEHDEWLASRGFRYVDTRLTLERAAPADLTLTGVRDADSTDVAALRRIAARGHRDARFYQDPRFAPAADRLYSYWIEKSVNDPATAVFVPEGHPAHGYITCYRVDDMYGQIGLVGVDESARGRGLGRGLVTAALAWCGRSGLPRMRVVTQAANEPASRLYQACGFMPAQTQWWYHRWLTDRSAQ
jgi:dTDP-4-amino-4,6-dideoxy-D-galactose acyltransferase